MGTGFRQPCAHWSGTSLDYSTSRARKSRGVRMSNLNLRLFRDDDLQLAMIPQPKDTLVP
ncbi:MAG: hypothetical protein COS85_20315 [Armatimonadetes bacterium CG07_land_8_20_14_0_80_59_28]|nr:MAG: hypothetical protein COS85_20315 [Armatimonadetes bacterium CG07_land_8_20_14_0_80_59_28]